MIAPPGAARVTIRFTEFSTQLLNDVVRVLQCTDIYCSQQEQLAELSGTYPSVQAVTSATGFIKVVFTSDSIASFDGFNATWSMVSKHFLSLCMYTYIMHFLLPFIHTHDYSSYMYIYMYIYI